MAQQSARRDQDNQGFQRASSTPRVIWIGSANSHTGQRRYAAAQQAGQMAASDYVSETPEFTLSLKGASKMGSGHWTPPWAKSDSVALRVDDQFSIFFSERSRRKAV